MNGWLEAIEISKRFLGLEALVRFSCSLRAGEVVGLIGPNGAGKTTVFNLISGFLRPDTGRVWLKGREITGLRPHRISTAGLVRTFQNVRLTFSLSVLDNLLLWWRPRPPDSLFSTVFQRRQTLRRDEQNRLAALKMLEGHGLAGHAYHLASQLSFGQQKLLSLLCCVAANPDILLLDEPVAGIDPAAHEQILAVVRSQKCMGKATLVIEHDMDVIEQLCDRVIFLAAGVVISSGTPAVVRADPLVMEAYLR